MFWVFLRLWIDLSCDFLRYFNFKLKAQELELALSFLQQIYGIVLKQ
jgi:hypothetical protein